MSTNQKKPGRPVSGRKPTTAIFARLDPALGKALDDYLASLRPRSTLAAVLTLAIEEYLARHDFWPASERD